MTLQSAVLLFRRPCARSLMPDWCWPVGGIDYETTAPVIWAGITVPAQYRFNVSIPRPLWWLLSPHNPRYLRAACLHDYALHKLHWGRVRAAAPFSEALRAEGLGRVHRLAMVLAVIVWKWR